MDKSYKESFSPSEHLVLELKCKDIFEGDFVEGGKDRVDLINVKQHNNPNEVLSTVYSFYRSEIKDIYKFRSEGSKPFSEFYKTIDMSRKEYNRLQDVIKNVTYLDNIDKRYYDALERLSKAEVIGVTSLGTDNDQLAVLKLLAICTWKNIYLFDLANVRNSTLHQQLKDILENEYICKVMHCARALTAILYNKYDVYVQNVFDTQMCDLIIQKTAGKDLLTTQVKCQSQCLSTYLNFPIYHLEEAENVTLKTWQEHPLDTLHRSYGAQLVAYLIPLKNKMNNVIFGEAFKSMNEVCSYYRNLSDTKFADTVNNMEISDEISALIPNLIKNRLNSDVKKIE